MGLLSPKAVRIQSTNQQIHMLPNEAVNVPAEWTNQLTFWCSHQNLQLFMNHIFCNSGIEKFLKLIVCLKKAYTYIKYDSRKI